MPKLNDLTGKRFGTLTVLGRAANRTTPNGNRFTYWLCKCDCGTLKEIRAEHLKAGKIVSCGCQQSKNGTANPAYKHGGTGTRLYYVWNGMHQRCYNPNNERYSSYGGRGIRVCAEWDDFATFRDWALSAGYDESASYGECTLDRINVNGNYCPDNCRWVNEAVQSRNRTTNIYLTYKGETKVLKDWARMLKTDGQVLKRRIEKGWTPEQIIETPIVASVN